MKRIFLLQLLAIFPFIFASPIVLFSEPSSLPDGENGFVFGSSERPLEFVTVSTPVSPAEKDSEIKFGHHQPVSRKPIQPHHGVAVTEHRGPVIPAKFPEVHEENPFILKHRPSVITNDEIPVSSIVPIIPSHRIPGQEEHGGVIPVTEEYLPEKPRHRTPHKPKHRRPHVPKHPRKHLPHLPKHHREIPIIPDDTKHHRFHLVPKHTRKIARKHRTDYEEENKI